MSQVSNALTGEPDLYSVPTKEPGGGGCEAAAGEGSYADWPFLVLLGTRRGKIA